MIIKIIIIVYGIKTYHIKLISSKLSIQIYAIITKKKEQNPWFSNIGYKCSNRYTNHLP